MAHEEPRRSLVRRALAEPTTHFAVLALALFGANAAVRATSGAHVVEIDPARVAARVARIEATVGAPLTAEQRSQVEKAYIDEQVLVREARALGLGDDPQVDNLLAQKMLDVLSADVIQPTDAELEAYYRANRQRYAAEATMTVDEIVFRTDGALPPALVGQLRRGVAPADLGSAASRVPMATEYDSLSRVTAEDLARIFGAATAARIAEAEPGAWVGPHPSVRGQHWFRVTSRTEAALPPLDTIRERVRLAWVTEQEQERLTERVEKLRARYRIEFAEPGAGS